METQILSHAKIYETFENMLGRVREANHEKYPSLVFFVTQIQPIIQRRWDQMNTPLHMETYVLNPKWYISKLCNIVPIDDPEIKKRFQAAITKMYEVDEAKKN